MSIVVVDMVVDTMNADDLPTEDVGKADVILIILEIVQFFTG